jgi:hypothetical protein
MKMLMTMLALMMSAVQLAAMAVPASETPVITDDNLLTGFQRVTPDDKAPETLQTKCWLWQDGDDLMLRMESEIDSTFKVGTRTTRDGYTEADYFRVQLITVPEAYYAYMYYVHPLGGLKDAVRSATSADIQWNSSYSYETSFNDTLWTATIRIPLAELRFKHELPYHWKIILTRDRPEMNETYNLPYLTTDMQNDYYAKAQKIELSHPVKRKLDLKLKPYFVKSYDLIAKSSSFDPDHLGLDIAFNPSQRVRIKASLNPDFSDVPPDNAADNYNSKYPPYYSENRFFFTEDIDALGVDMNNFYTRNIVQPSFAFKVTGTTGKLNWGALGAKDQEIVNGGVMINPDDYYQVLALIPAWKNLRLSNSLISRVNKDYYSHVYRGNYRWNFARDFYLSSTVMGSLRDDDRIVDADIQSGFLTTMQLNAFPGNWNGAVNYIRCSKDFTSDAGYFWYDNYECVNANLGWDSEEMKGFVTDHGFSVWGSYYRRFDLADSENDMDGSYYICLNDALDLSLGGGLGNELDDLGANHDEHYYKLYASFYKWEPFMMSGSVYRQKTLVYSLFDTYDLTSLSLSLSGTPTKSLSYSLSGSWNDYGYARENTVVIDTTSFTVDLDNRYLVMNGSATYIPNSRLRFSTGIGLSSYETAASHASLTYYASLRYEFKKECFLFMGYTTRQNQDIASSYSDPLGHFRKSTASMYAKVMITI